MKYLPFEDFEIHTTMSTDEVFYRLRAAVDTKRKWLIFTNKPFWGEVERRYFRMWRPTWMNHNFRPVVSGRILAKSPGSDLQIRMRMPWLSFLFYAFILGWLWYLYFGEITNLIIQRVQTGTWQIESPWMLLPPIAMFAFAYLISVGTFRWEASYVKKYLLWLSESTEEDITYQDRILGVKESQIMTLLLIGTIVASLGWIAFNLLRDSSG